MTRIYDDMFPHWEYVDDCYKGVIALKSPQKMEQYLPKFPVEARSGRNGNHRHNRPCWCKSHRRATLLRRCLVGNVMG